jgi:hypothetical protein
MATAKKRAPARAIKAAEPAMEASHAQAFAAPRCGELLIPVRQIRSFPA